MSGINWKENIKIDIHDPEGRLIDTTEFSNQLTNVGLDFMARALMVSTQDTEIKYLAWGLSSSTALATNTLLSSEKGRKLITTQSSSNYGVVHSVCYLGPSEATTDIEELGWFAGSSASITANSGRLISRVLYSRSKTSLESVTITRTDTFSTG